MALKRIHFIIEKLQRLNLKVKSNKLQVKINLSRVYLSTNILELKKPLITFFFF